MNGAADPPADDVSGKYVDDESHIDVALQGGDIGEIADPKTVWARGAQFPVDPVQRTRCGLVADRRAQGLAANNALQATSQNS
jgi:hypothetical protein